MDKIALLDTDFAVKTIMSQKDDGIHLMDLFVAVSGFCFACHKQTVTEVSNHDYNGAYKWFKEQIDNGKIKEYSDNEIIDILEELYGSSACVMYRQFLKASCNTQITVISLFYHLKEWGISKEEAEPYYAAYEKNSAGKPNYIQSFLLIRKCDEENSLPTGV